MSNPMFENPKIALGFAGVVVAAALVASVAFKEFSPSDEGSGEALSEQQAQAAPAVSQQSQAGFASGPATGWANDAGATDDWGAPVASSQGGGFAEVPGVTNDAPVFGDHVSKTVSNGAPDRSSGPAITSRAAPGAPEVRPPQPGPQREITLKGN
jgi:hypothetical protein